MAQLSERLVFRFVRVSFMLRRQSFHTVRFFLSSFLSLACVCVYDFNWISNLFHLSHHLHGLRIRTFTPLALAIRDRRGIECVVNINWSKRTPQKDRQNCVEMWRSNWQLRNLFVAECRQSILHINTVAVKVLVDAQNNMTVAHHFCMQSIADWCVPPKQRNNGNEAIIIIIY